MVSILDLVRESDPAYCGSGRNSHCADDEQRNKFSAIGVRGFL
jgi:hypothetical protein